MTAYPGSHFLVFPTECSSLNFLIFSFQNEISKNLEKVISKGFCEKFKRVLNKLLMRQGICSKIDFLLFGKVLAVASLTVGSSSRLVITPKT